jgi:AcrR family transcriptional regulator
MAKAPAKATGQPLRELPDVDSLRGGQRERRERIVDAALRLMAETEYAKIQVKDVTDEAGVALGTLYRYFHSKDHLFACALSKWAEGFAPRFEQAPQDKPEERVKTVFHRAARAFEKQPRLFDVLFQIQATKDTNAMAVFSEFSRQRQENFNASLVGISSPDREDIVSVMSAVLTESLREWQLGLLTMTETYRRLDRTAELLFR